MAATAEKKEGDRTSARRLMNRANAVRFAKAGLYVFISDGKVPLIPRFTTADTDLSLAERTKVVEEFTEKHDRPPIHVGSTRDEAVIKAMFKAFPDAVPSIACGPSNLVVLDADSKDDGPAKLGKLFADNGGIPAGAPVIPTRSGGQHIVFRPNGELTNRAGALKSDYGTDVRGKGGQFVAPGSERVDGKTYGSQLDRLEFIKAIVTDSIPTVPEFIVAEIAKRGTVAHDDSHVTHSREREVVADLQADWPDFDVAFDETIGRDLNELRAADPEFDAIYHNPPEDKSTARWQITRHLMRYWPDLTVTELACFLGEWAGSGDLVDSQPKSGEYDHRQIAREWLKNQGLEKQHVATDGSSFDAVADEDDGGPIKPLASKGGQLRFFDDLAIYAEPDWTIENLFWPGQLGMIHGPSNTGKTFLTLHTALSLSDGRHFFGLNVEACGVLYCYGEGHGGLQNRAAAYRKEHPETKGLNLIVRSGIPAFGENPVKAAKELRQTIKDANAELKARGGLPLKVVFIDTFSKAIAGANENDAAEVQPILNLMRAVAEQCGVTVIPIHHSGKATENGARGSSAIFADVDFNLELIGHEDAKKRKLKDVPAAGNMMLFAPKLRDAAKSNIKMEFSLRDVQLGTNKWGNPTGSLVVVEVGTEARSTGGESLEAVDESAPQVDDNLEVETEKQADAARDKLVIKVMDTFFKLKVPFKGTIAECPVDEVARKLPSLSAVFAGDNKSRDLKLYLFGLDGKNPAISRLVDQGRLSYVPATRMRAALLRFEAIGPDPLS